MSVYLILHDGSVIYTTAKARDALAHFVGKLDARLLRSDDGGHSWRVVGRNRSMKTEKKAT